MALESPLMQWPMSARAAAARVAWRELTNRLLSASVISTLPGVTHTPSAEPLIISIANCCTSDSECSRLLASASTTMGSSIDATSCTSACAAVQRTSRSMSHSRSHSASTTTVYRTRSPKA